ncbi:hypothetical protein LINPERHAP2_LOCUS1377, partial [Linum perenne]
QSRVASRPSRDDLRIGRWVSSSQEGEEAKRVVGNVKEEGNFILIEECIELQRHRRADWRHEKHIENGSLNGGEEAKKEVDVKNEEGKKEISNGEECDPSNKCLIEDSKLVACIRVPGNDAPDLSLLIQNNGEVPVSLTILSPDFVHLEKNSIQLQQKEKRK